MKSILYISILLLSLFQFFYPTFYTWAQLHCINLVILSRLFYIDINLGERVTHTK
jgi:hypothetical protein